MTDRRPTANACQRERRARYARIDYYPSPVAQAIVRANLGEYYPDNILSGVLNRIVIEWAAVNGQSAGLKCGEAENPMAAAFAAGVLRPVRAHANEFGEERPELPLPSRPRARANEFGKSELFLACKRHEATNAQQAIFGGMCGGRRRRDGQPCRAKCEPGKRRCRWHGGLSTGPRTNEGKAKALANLRQNRTKNELES